MISSEFTRTSFKYKDKKANEMLTIFCQAFFHQFSFKLLFFSKDDRVKVVLTFLMQLHKRMKLSM
jgi:hypothetical protein